MIKDRNDFVASTLIYVKFIDSHVQKYGGSNKNKCNYEVMNRKRSLIVIK